jgi:hypothetical protein
MNVKNDDLKQNAKINKTKIDYLEKNFQYVKYFKIRFNRMGYVVRVKERIDGFSKTI